MSIYPLLLCPKCGLEAKRTNTWHKNLTCQCSQDLDISHVEMPPIKSHFSVAKNTGSWSDAGFILPLVSGEGDMYRVETKSIQNILPTKGLDVGVWDLREMLKGRRHFQLNKAGIKRSASKVRVEVCQKCGISKQELEGKYHNWNFLFCICGAKDSFQQEMRQRHEDQQRLYLCEVDIRLNRMIFRTDMDEKIEAELLPALQALVGDRSLYLGEFTIAVKENAQAEGHWYCAAWPLTKNELLWQALRPTSKL